MKNFKFILEVDSNTNEQHLSIINDYWKIDNNKFINLPSSIEAKYNISRPDLLNIIQKNSTLKLLVNCSVCDEIINDSASSQTDYKNKLRKFPTLKCNRCLEKEKDRITELQKKEESYIKDKMLEAIVEESWTLLNNLELNILKGMLSFQDFKAFTKSEHPKYEKKFFWRTIFRLDSLFLIHLIKNSNNSITDYKFLPNLKESVDLLKLKPHKRLANQPLDKLSFRLAKNRTLNEYDETIYSGIITFKQEITITPNTKYSYGVWEKENGDMHISIISLDELKNTPKQSRIECEPVHIQEVIKEYFRAIKTTEN